MDTRGKFFRVPYSCEVRGTGHLYSVVRGFRVIGYVPLDMPYKAIAGEELMATNEQLAVLHDPAPTE